MNKMKQNDNKNHLKQQIQNKKFQNLENWRNEIEYEKEIVNNQISGGFGNTNRKGIMTKRKTSKEPGDKK